MLKRILGLLGWIGVALVFAAVAIRFLEAGMAAVLQRAGHRRPRLHAALHPQPVARDRRSRSPGRQARFGTLAVASILVVLGILVGDQLPRHPPQQALGPDRGATSSRCRTRRKKVLQDLKEPVNVRVFARSDDFQRFRDRLDEYTYQSKQVTAEYIDPEKQAGAAQQYGVTRSARSCSTTRAATRRSTSTASRS